MSVPDTEHWLEQQVVGLRARSDEELLEDPFYIQYLNFLSSREVTELINTFLLG